jgi:hypothetical protein
MQQSSCSSGSNTEDSDSGDEYCEREVVEVGEAEIIIVLLLLAQPVPVSIVLLLLAQPGSCSYSICCW